MIKTFAIAAATSVALTSAAAADGAFSSIETEISSATVELGNVRASAPGVVSIYDYNTGVRGALLGTEEIASGANYDVRVNVGVTPINDVLAVLTVDGQEVDMIDLDTVR